MKSISVALIMAAFMSVASANVLKSYDAENHCTLYRATKTEEPTEIGPMESIHSSRAVYGLSIIDMDIDFNAREVSVTPMMNIVMGFNRALVGGPVRISADNKDFKMLINQLNRKIIMFEKVCIDDQKLIYATLQPTEQPQN